MTLAPPPRPTASRLRPHLRSGLLVCFLCTIIHLLSGQLTVSSGSSSSGQAQMVRRESNALVAPKRNTPATNGSSVQQANNVQAQHQQPAAVDDILKDTMLLLDALDQRLSSVQNKTPNAMMRDNLRSLDGATAAAEQLSGPGQQYLGALGARALDEGAEGDDFSAPDGSVEETLVRLAEGFSPGRRAYEGEGEEPMSSAASSLPPGAALAPEAAEPSSSAINQAANGGPPKVGSSQTAAASGMGTEKISPGASTSSTSSSTTTISSLSAALQPPVTAGASGSSQKRSRQLLSAQAAASSQQQPPMLIPAAQDDNQLASDSTERHIKFTLDLMQSIFSSQSYSPKTNLIESFLISPLSIQMVLMMMHLGARGQTRREINKCLHLSSQPSSSLEKALLNLQQQQQLLGPANDLSPLLGDLNQASGSKLKRRHQQGGNIAANDNDNANAKAAQQQQQQQQQSTRQQQQQQSSSSNIREQNSAQQQAAAGNAHELFGAAMRNLLKDPMVMKALTSANQIFLQKNLPLSPQYEWAIKHYYAADVKLVDFQHQTSASPTSSTLLSSSFSSPASSPLPSGPGSTAAPGASNMGNPDGSKASKAQSERHSSHDHSQTTLNSTSSANGTAGAEQLNNIQQMVNDWVERQTKGRISNFLSSPVSTSTLMMAINVLYFKGDWQYKFDPSDTETDAWFTQANGKTVKIPMMVNRLPLAFAHDPSLKTSVIELPYKAQRLGLFLLLPDETSGIFHTMQMLNSTSFANLISSMRKPSPMVDQASNGINVRIPKFSIESSPRLSQILSQQLGLRTLFSPDSANLSGMFAPQSFTKQRSGGSNATMPAPSSSSPGNNNGDNSNQTPLQVGLDELLHKAVLQVDEQGSVAAASSATVVERVGLFNSNYFEADHPFLLFLMDKQTGLVLFSGAFAGGNNNGNLSNNQETPQQHQHQQKLQH